MSFVGSVEPSRIRVDVALPAAPRRRTIRERVHHLRAVFEGGSWRSHTPDQQHIALTAVNLFRSQCALISSNEISNFLPVLEMSEMMSILKLLGKHMFDVNTTIILASAFDDAWLSLQTSGSRFATDERAAATRELLAQRIIVIAQRGERDSRRIVGEALAQFVNST